MKKLFSLLLTFALTLTTIFALSSCDKTESKNVKTINYDLSSEEYAFAVKKGDTELLASINQFFKDNDAEIKNIFNKYLNASADELSSFGDNTIKTEPSAHSENDGELVVATNLDFSPFEYKNGNKIAGIDMEIVQLLATALNKTLVIVDMDFDAVVESVQNVDTYDVAVAGLTITPERAEVVAFSDAYFGATQVIVTLESDTTFDSCKSAEDVENVLKSLEGAAAKCGGQIATTSQFYINGSEDLGFTGFANLKFSPYQNAALAIKDMQNGNIAFVVVDKTTAAALVAGINN